MVSPNLLVKKLATDQVEVSDNVKRVFQAVYNEVNKPVDKQEDESVIRVSDLISKMAFFYEKLRNAVDYEEEHLLRKNAIVRILKRQVIIEGVIRNPDTEELAFHLLTELIRASYLPNGQIPEKRITEVAAILQKYLTVKNLSLSKLNPVLVNQNTENKELIKKRTSSISWLLTLAACEIEDLLVVNKIKQATVNSLFNILSKQIKLPPNHKNSEDLLLQIYLSIGRNFLKLDNDMLSLIVFKYYNEGWSEEGQISPSEQTIKKIVANLSKLPDLIYHQVNHPLARQLDLITRRYALYFSVLNEAIDGEPVNQYNLLKNNSKSFFASIAKVCQKRYKQVKSRLWRAAIRSIIYIFLTKSIFVVLIEVPAIKWFGEELNLFTLGINIAFPAALLFLIVLLTRTPSQENTNKIIEGIQEIAVVGQERQQNIILRPPTKRGVLTSVIFNFLYGVSFLASLYFIYRVLTLLNFNWVSIIIFLFFLAFVSFFSVRVTKGVKELLVVERKESLIAFLVDLFYMPIILAGKWLSKNASRVNVFIFIFDFIIEAPFKVLVNVAEEWTRYVRERRDNIT